MYESSLKEVESIKKASEKLGKSSSLRQVQAHFSSSL